LIIGERPRNRANPDYRFINGENRHSIAIGDLFCRSMTRGNLSSMRPAALFLAAGLLEIGGGYLVWLWLREQRALALGVLGFVALALYGVVPVLQPREHPFGRVYAAYGAVFIALSALWGWLLDGKRPDLRDAIGVAICLAGAMVMIWPRAAHSS
jgi:small multidrug resistance family-3 protein